MNTATTYLGLRLQHPCIAGASPMGIWAAILHSRIKASIAVSGGVKVPADGIKALLAGADAVQLVSALLRHGPAYIAIKVLHNPNKGD